MRRALLLFSVAFIVPASVCAEVTVTYSQDSERVCPANSYLIGSVCQCSLGYIAKDKACVKPEPAVAATPSQYQIYEDVLMSVTINEKMTCAQIGMITATDLDMCTRYKATPDDKKYQWKSIPRPAYTPSAVVLNPWAPPSQQVMGGEGATTTIEPTIVEKPKPAEPVAQKPEEPKPEETKPVAAPAPVTSEEEITPAKALAELSSEMAKKTDPAPEPEPVAPAPEQPVPENLAQLAGAAATEIATTTDPVDMITLSTILTPLPPDPVKTETPSDLSEEQPVSFFAKIKLWFLSIF